MSKLVSLLLFTRVLSVALGAEINLAETEKRWNALFTRTNQEGGVVPVVIGPNIKDDIRNVNLRFGALKKNEKGELRITVLRTEFEKKSGEIVVDAGGNKKIVATELPLLFEDSSGRVLLHVFPGEPDAGLYAVEEDGEHGLKMTALQNAVGETEDKDPKTKAICEVSGLSMTLDESGRTQYGIIGETYWVSDVFSEARMLKENGVPLRGENGFLRYESISSDEVPKLVESKVLESMKKSNLVWKQLSP